MSDLKSSLTVSAFNSSGAVKQNDFPVTIDFTPSELGLIGIAPDKLPKSIKISENKIEEKTFRHFGLTDPEQVKARLQTEKNPFEAVRTSGNLTAYLNSKTGKYVVYLSIEKNLYRALANKAREIKTEIRAVKEKEIKNSSNPNENFAGRNGINQTDFQRTKFLKLLKDAEIMPTSFGLPTDLRDLNHVVVTLPPNVSPNADSALSAYIEKRYGNGNLFGQDKLDILNSAKLSGVKIENLKISPENFRVVEFDLSIESLLKLQKSYLDVQYKVNKNEALAEKIKHEMALNQFLLGAMQGAWDDVKGIYNTVSSPLQTVQQIREAIGILSQLSAEDLKAITAELGNKAKNATPGEAAYGAGYVVGTAIVEIILGKGAGAAISALGKTKTGAQFLARLGNIADKTSELANLGKLKIAEAFSDEAANLASLRARQKLASLTFHNGAAGAEVLADLTVIAGNKIKNGAVKFTDFSKQMIAEVGEKVKPYLERLYRENLVSLELSSKKQIIAANGKVIDEVVLKEAKEKVIQYIQENKVKELKVFLYEIGNKYGNDFQNDLKNTVEKSIDNIYEGRKTTELHDMFGGHTIYDLFDGKIDTKHVGRTIQQLRERLAEQPNIPYASSFNDLETAKMAQMRFMKSYGKEIEEWFTKTSERQFKGTLELNQDLGNIVGKGKFGVRVGTKVEVVIERTSTGRNWFIMTSYPTP